MKLAHIFVHFFKIGGGESYLSKFSYYNNIFEETIFVNKNYNNLTLFNNHNNFNIILYNDYIELNNIIKEYDIIIDHQLYWFELDITKKTFMDISHNKIIRIIHGVPIHHININEYNFNYSIELYNDINSHNSWNNHIKIYNNIGIKRNNKNILDKNILDENNINIALVGRINEDKIPINFLKLLINFLIYYKKYIFNFYGEIDKSYLYFFMSKIKNNKNIIYHGIINPNEINNIYLKNDILLHPSKMEAGATVVLEAMSYGLPIICRHTIGLESAVGDKKYNYLCKNEEEMFKSLLKINNSNYINISNNNILKILNENNEKMLFTKLINEIKFIYDYKEINDKYDEIPNIIHYVYGLKKQTEEFPFVYYLSILSNYIINKPKTIFFHYQYLPYGYWWNKAKKYLKLNFINTTDIYWGKKKIIKFAHKADKIRLEMLLKYGGIYMDIDTITYRSYENLLKYDFVIGIQEENYNLTETTLYCNAILFSKRNNIFIKKWIEEYENHFVPSGWCEASVHLPGIILKNLNENPNNSLKNIKILDKEYFYSPLYNEVEKIFENNGIINDNLLTLHLWNTYSEKYFKNILNFDWCFTNNSLYSLLIKNILNNYLDLDLDLDLDLNKIYNISIITVFNDKLDYKKLLYSIGNQKDFYKLNLELIVIDNTSKFNDIYNNDSDLKKIFLEKNFDIKIVELNVEQNIYNAFNIGIKLAKNELISLLNIDDIITNNNGILLQCYNYENIILSDNKYKIVCGTNNANINKLNNNLINELINKTSFQINNIIFNKNNLNYLFPNKKNETIYFFILNTLLNNNIYFDNNIITCNNNFENNLFKYESEKIDDNIDNIIYNYYDEYNYINLLKEIYSY